MIYVSCTRVLLICSSLSNSTDWMGYARSHASLHKTTKRTEGHTRETKFRNLCPHLRREQTDTIAKVPSTVHVESDSQDIRKTQHVCMYSRGFGDMFSNHGAYTAHRIRSSCRTTATTRTITNNCDTQSPTSVITL